MYGIHQWVEKFLHKEVTMENFLTILNLLLDFLGLKGAKKIKMGLMLKRVLLDPISLEGAREIIEKVGKEIESGIRGVKIKLTIYECGEGKFNLVPLFINAKGEEVSINIFNFISKELYDFIIDGFNPEDGLSDFKIYETYYKYRLDMSKGEKLDLINGQVMAGGKAIKPGKFVRLLGLDENTASLFADAVLSNQLLTLSEDMISIKKVSEVYNSTDLKASSCMTGEGYDLSVLEEAGAEVICLSNLKGEIVARTLLWENRYFDRLYAISKKLEMDFEIKLEEMGYAYIEDGDKNFKSRWVEGSPSSRFMPFMDTLDGVEVDGNRFRFYGE